MTVNYSYTEILKKSHLSLQNLYPPETRESLLAISGSVLVTISVSVVSGSVSSLEYKKIECKGNGTWKEDGKASASRTTTNPLLSSLEEG